MDQAHSYLEKNKYKPIVKLKLAIDGFRRKLAKFIEPLGFPSDAQWDIPINEMDFPWFGRQLRRKILSKMIKGG